MNICSLESIGSVQFGSINFLPIKNGYFDCTISTMNRKNSVLQTDTAATKFKTSGELEVVTLKRRTCLIKCNRTIVHTFQSGECFLQKNLQNLSRNVYFTITPNSRQESYRTFRSFTRRSMISKVGTAVVNYLRSANRVEKATPIDSGVRLKGQMYAFLGSKPGF